MYKLATGGKLPFTNPDDVKKMKFSTKPDDLDISDELKELFNLMFT
jgi:hypothetical protein